MIINHNIAALNTYRQLGSANNGMQNSMEKLSSGLRINKAGDDAAGLAISEKMRGQIRGLDQAQRNAQDGISMIQTAEGALNETHSILQRMRELATQASNDTNTDTDRDEIQKEMNQLTSEINRIGNTTEFNTQTLMNGDKTISSTTTGVTQGVFTLSGLASSLTYTIDGQTISGLSGAAANASDVASAINNNTSLAAKYTAAATGSNVKLTQVTGTESSSAVTVGTNLTVTTGTTGSSGTTVTSGGITFQIGANGGQSMTVEMNDMRSFSTGTNGLNIATTETGATSVTADSGKVAYYTTGLNVTDGTNNTDKYKALDVSTHDKATAAIDVINDAIQSVSAERSKMGAYQNRLDHTINNLGTSSENLTAAESRIRDVDMAKEMMNQTKESILAQASQAMLAKANQNPQGVLQLLR
jgi:flagellin